VFLTLRWGEEAVDPHAKEKEKEKEKKPRPSPSPTRSAEDAPKKEKESARDDKKPVDLRGARCACARRSAACGRDARLARCA
jgi:hypothetical protein